MNEKIVKKTQETLGKIIKKPPLAEKLLNKPPFRFLHDLIMSVIKTTGFMKGLYTDKECQSDNVKDRDSKIAFLQKAIAMVSLVVGKELSVRASKVVAGHDPEKTNEFLQQLAAAINKKVDNDEYVQKVLNGETKSSSKKGSKDEKKEKEEKGEKKERDRDRDRSGDRRKREKRDKEEDSERKSKRHEDRERSRDRDRSGERDREKSSRHRKKDREGSADRKENDGDERRRRKREKEKAQEEANNNKEEEEGPTARIPRPTSAKGSRSRHHREVNITGGESDEEEAKPPAAPAAAAEPDDGGSRLNGQADLEPPPQVANNRRMRPSSARPAAPRVKKTEAQPAEHLTAGNVPNVIIDKGNKSDSESEDEGFITKDDQLDAASLDHHTQNAGMDNEDDDGEHGGLVKKILETKKELEDGSGQPAKKTQIERSPVNDAARRKERERTQKEIDTLRQNIQTLTRSVLPLAKVLDFVQEDLDQMQKELDTWKQEHRQNRTALRQENDITENMIEPLRAQLIELDQMIADKHDQIGAVKSNILRNDEKINKMLSSVANTT